MSFQSLAEAVGHSLATVSRFFCWLPVACLFWNPAFESWAAGVGQFGGGAGVAFVDASLGDVAPSEVAFELDSEVGESLGCGVSAWTAAARSPPPLSVLPSSFFLAPDSAPPVEAFGVGQLRTATPRLFPGFPFALPSS